jgi:hypothetical protein
MSTTETDVFSRWAQGCADATNWLPTATADELREFAEMEHRKGTVPIYNDHTLAAYWGKSHLSPAGGPVGDVQSWDEGYGAGFYGVLHNAGAI